jgi:RNA polymerase-binding transcription factor DksA
MTADNLTRPEAITPIQLHQFRTALDEQRAFRRQQLGGLGVIDPAAAEPDDPLTDVLGSLRTAAQHALAEIDAAVHRLNNGQYGICITCGQPIAVERLEVLPSAARCMPCQRAAEWRGR